MHKLIRLLLCIGLCFLAAGIGSFFTAAAIPEWYSQLNKPFFNPPNWIFGPVWSLLYFLMGISLFLLWDSSVAKKQKKKAAQYFFLQLGLNVLWSIIFFGLHSPLLALGEIVALWIAIFLTIRSFLRINKVAGWLLLPYIAWVSFAVFLNLFIAVLN